MAALEVVASAVEASEVAALVAISLVETSLVVLAEFMMKKIQLRSNLIL